MKKLQINKLQINKFIKYFYIIPFKPFEYWRDVISYSLVVLIFKLLPNDLKLKFFDPINYIK